MYISGQRKYCFWSAKVFYHFYQPIYCFRSASLIRTKPKFSLNKSNNFANKKIILLPGKVYAFDDSPIFYSKLMFEFSVPSEIALLRREHFNRWFKLAPYYWALLLGRLPIQIGLVVIYLTITYPMSVNDFYFVVSVIK